MSKHSANAQPAASEPAQPPHKKGPSRAGITMPLLIEAAPWAFMCRGHDLERLRKAYCTTRRRSLEALLAGICTAIGVEPERTGRPAQVRRIA